MKHPAYTSRAHALWMRLCTACLAIYMAYITYLAHSDIFLSAKQTVTALVCFAALSTVLYALLSFVCARLCVYAPKSAGERQSISLPVFLLALGIALAVFGCTFAAYHPGGVNYDISNQWRQVQSGEYNNWHPLMHTLMIWLATRVADSYPFVLLLQVIAFALALSYLTAVLHRHGVPAWLALTIHTVISLSLPVRNTLMYVGKDSAMTIAVLLLAAWTVRILYTNGQWLRKPLHIAAMGAVLAVCTLVRHNAMLWTYVLVAAVFCCFKRCRRHAAACAALMAALLVLIQGPLFGMLNVVYPQNLVDESMGIPMTILGDVKQLQPDALDEETTAFLATLATEEEWQTTYKLHNYNSIKFTFDREYVARRSPVDILSMTARAAAAAPRTAFEAVNGLTDLVWDVTGQNEGYPDVRNSGSLPTYATGNAALNRVGRLACSVLDLPNRLPPLRWLTQNVGVQLLLLLLVTLWALRRHGVRVLVLALPTLVYDLGTMMLLASNDARFFQFSMTIAMPCVLAMLYLPKEVKQPCR